MEKICKNCLNWREESFFHPKVGTCLKLTSLKKESGEIIGWQGVATGELYGKDCEYFKSIGVAGVEGHPDPIGKFISE